MPDVLHRPEVAASRLGLGRTMVFRLIATGELQSVKIGRARRVPQSAIDSYIARLLAVQDDDQRGDQPTAAA